MTARYVNGSLNLAHFAGYAYGVDGDLFFMRQHADPATALRFHVDPTFRPPPDNRAVEVTAHVRAVDGVPELHLISVSSASVGSVPPSLSWVGALRGRSSDPFATPEAVRAQVSKALHAEDAVVESILRTAAQGKRYGFRNRVDLSGFIGPKRIVTPDEGEPYMILTLQQHPEAERGIPVMIPRIGSARGLLLHDHFPLCVRATARYARDAVAGSDLEAPDENAPVPVHLVLTTTGPTGVRAAMAADFEGQSMPAWGTQALATFHAELLAKRADKAASGPSRPTPEQAPDDTLTEEERSLGLTPDEAQARREKLAALGAT